MNKTIHVMAGMLIMLLLWSLGAWWLDTPLLLPGPLDAARSAMALIVSGELAQHISSSLGRLLVALVLGVPAGAVIGCAMGRWAALDAMLNPFVRMFNAIPAIALVPFSLLLFGVSEVSRYALLFYTVSLTVLLSARQGVRNVPPLRLRAAQMLGTGRKATFFKVILPSCVPQTIAGTRTAIGLGVMVVVAAEMLGADSGVGYLIMQARSQFNVGNLMTGILTLGILSVVLDWAFVAGTERLLPRWSSKHRIR